MRMLMHVQFPVEAFNAAVRDGTAGEKIQKILKAIRPEAAYFSEYEGRRGGVLVVNVNKPADVPALAEPWSVLRKTKTACLLPSALPFRGASAKARLRRKRNETFETRFGNVWR